MKLARRQLVLCGVLASLLATPALAVDERQKKAAVAMAEQGARAFQAGDMAKAATQYLLAARTDPDEPNYLYGAARAEQATRQLDAAEQHYKAYALAPRADPARVVKVQQYLLEIRGERAQERAAQAERLGQKGDAVLAAPTWLEAYQLAPDRPQYLLNAALAEREAGDTASAIQHLDLYLRVAPADASERGRAASLVQQMRKSSGRTADPTPTPQVVAAKIAQSPVVAPSVAKPSPATPALAEPPGLTVVSPAADVGGTRTAGVWTTIIGVTAGAAGVGLLAWGLSEQATLNKDLGYADGAVHTAVSREDALARASTISSHQTIGAILGGAGLAATGVGLWLWLRAPDRSAQASGGGAIVPAGNGVAWLGRF